MYSEKRKEGKKRTTGNRVVARQPATTYKSGQLGTSGGHPSIVGWSSAFPSSSRFLLAKLNFELRLSFRTRFGDFWSDFKDFQLRIQLQKLHQIKINQVDQHYFAGFGIQNCKYQVHLTNLCLSFLFLSLPLFCGYSCFSYSILFLRIYLNLNVQVL